MIVYGGSLLKQMIGFVLHYEIWEEYMLRI